MRASQNAPAGEIPAGKKSMPSITIQENESFEVAVRRFKRMVERAGLIADMRARAAYEKPTTRRKRKKLLAVKRRRRRIRMQSLPRRLF